MNERTLFEKYVAEPTETAARTLARSRDPDTSRDAAKKIVGSGKHGEQSRNVHAALREHGPCTSAELALASGLDRYLVARRLPDLARKGLAKRLVFRNERVSRACKATGNKAMVWETR